MIVIFKPDVDPDSAAIEQVRRIAGRFDGVQSKIHVVEGTERSVTEVYLIGSTGTVPTEVFEDVQGVEKVVRVSEKYRLIGRHAGQLGSTDFVYQGVPFGDDHFHVVAGLCAVDNPKNTERMFAAIQEAGLEVARMGAYKPRTSPYDFQGRGKDCLPWVFELAGKYGVKVVAMEITHESHLDEITEALRESGDPTGVLIQIGTRNAQNFELLKAVGQQKRFPVLFKRGMGITLQESLNACEYVASEGNRKIILCLRGMKTQLGDPHRNFVDFAHVPVVKRLTRLPVCIDPSHSVGRKEPAPDGFTDIHHATAQGVIAGANMVLVDFHPEPSEALCDGPQALTLPELAPYLEDTRIVRECYLARRKAFAAAG